MSLKSKSDVAINSKCHNPNGKATIKPKCQVTKKSGLDDLSFWIRVVIASAAWQSLCQVAPPRLLRLIGISLAMTRGEEGCGIRKGATSSRPLSGIQESVITRDES